MTDKKIFICTGEHSGDKLGAVLTDIILQKYPSWQIKALGGSSLEQAGADIVISNKLLDIIGVSEVITRLPQILKTWRQLKKQLLAFKPDLVICIDNPGLNLKIAKFAKTHDMPVLFYVSPQIWAWKAQRSKMIQKYVDHIALLFPFEKKIYDAISFPNTVVGHPMLQRLVNQPSKSQARSELSLSQTDQVLTILPGSRTSEIKRLMPVILDTCIQLNDTYPSLKIFIAKANSIQHLDIPQPLQSYIKVLTNQTETAVAVSDFVICASGTATLEVALANKPMVVIYKTSALTYAIAKRVIKTPDIALCNIVLGERIAPELVQHQLTADSLFSATQQLIESGNTRQQMTEKFAQIPALLGQQHDPSALLAVVENLIN